MNNRNQDPKPSTTDRSLEAPPQWTLEDLKLARRMRRWRTIRSAVLIIGVMGLVSAITKAAEPLEHWLFGISPLLHIVVMTLLALLLLAAMIFLVYGLNAWLKRRDERGW